ncbi:MAG: efflux RND transporter periplasmic adaptor subunit [Gemmatimonadetes bacterium]|nr:efflux RND transporter periplasmic adaptor subunit [Gemmatimonadota bacterium]
MRHFATMTLTAPILTTLTALLLMTGCTGGEASDPASAQDMGAMGDASTDGMDMGGRPMRITGRQASLAGVSFAVVREAELDRTVRAVAMVVPDEGRTGIVNSRVGGWIELLYADETGRHVQIGEPLFELYAPDLVTAQEELLLALRLGDLQGADSMVVGARRRLARWGIADSLITAIERTGTVRETLTIVSPFSGHILDKYVLVGERIEAGQDLYRIADLSTVWIEARIFEQDADLVAVGQPAEVTFEARPGRPYRGRVAFVYPMLDADTRTLRVRITVPNPTGDIRPMMYATVRIRARAPRGTVVPLTAVLPTGDRDLAFVVRGGGIVPVAVTVGMRGDSTILVIDGLAVGDTVVASATFLFDSESSLAAAMAGIMLDMGMGLDMGGMDMGDAEAGGTGGMDMSGADTSATARREDSP